MVLIRTHTSLHCSSVLLLSSPFFTPSPPLNFSSLLSSSFSTISIRTFIMFYIELWSSSQNCHAVITPLLSSVRRALSQLGLASSGSTQNSGTVVTSDGSLGVGKYSGDVQTSLALYIHKVGSWLGNQCFQLVLLGLRGRVWVQQILY